MSQFNTENHINYLRYLHQEGPYIGNQYLEDSALKGYIKLFLPDKVLAACEPGLIDLGDKVVREILDYHKDAEKNPPKLEPYDVYGRQINNLITGRGW